MSSLLQLVPEYHPRVWGGQRLKAAQPPIGEAWIVFEHNRVLNGAWAGRTLAEVAEAEGAALLGEPVVRQTGRRFPLLIKLLDCADWLSIQVHPNDAQAVQWEGPGHFGKTEAWHILEAEPGARLIAGVRPGTTPETLAGAIRGGTIQDYAEYHPVAAGDSVFMPAGTLHALGPGLLLYEVQQTSDITYRVFDWGRPASAGRALHLEQSVAVTDVTRAGDLRRAAPLPPDGRRTLLDCAYFALEAFAAGPTPRQFTPGGESFHALTVTAGEAVVAAGSEAVRLGRFESVLVPAAGGAYTVRAEVEARLLLSRVPA